MSKNRICFIDYNMSAIGGVEQVTTALVNSLCNNYEIYLLSIIGKNETPYKLDERVRFSCITDTELRLSKMQSHCSSKIATFLKENKIDVAIIQGTYAGFVAAPVRFKCKTKLVFCDHGALMNQWKEKSTTLARLIAALLSHKVVTLTEQSRDDYKRKFLLRDKKVACIYNWIDLNIPRSEKYDKSSKRIVSAGRFGKEKGFDLLVKSYAKVAERHPDWTLDIFGDGVMMDTVKGLVDELGLKDKVNLLGMRSDLAEHYKDYAMYVLPSYREGMPLVLLEAKANRLPIVSFDILTGPREIITHGVDGFLVEPYNLDKMADDICVLIEDDELRSRMSDNSQNNLDKFSKETILNMWKNLIKTL